MAHTYVINAPVRTGETVTVTGTVDGTAVTVTEQWIKFVSFPNVASQITFVESLMLAAVPPVPVTIPGIAGTYTV